MPLYDAVTSSRCRHSVPYAHDRLTAGVELARQCRDSSALPGPALNFPTPILRVSEAIRRVRQRADGLGLVLLQPGHWGAALKAYLAEVKRQREYAAQPRAKAA